MENKDDQGITIAQLAKVVNTSTKKIMEQLREAGVYKESELDIIYDHEKVKLLAHLKAGFTKPATPAKKTRLLKTSNKTITVEVRKKKPYIINENPTNLEQKNSIENTQDLSASNTETETNSIKAIRWSKLRSVEVKNFKAIENLEVPLADVTILVGPNGSGKSSVLQAIHWAARAASYIEPKKQTEVISFDRLDYSPSSEPLRTAHRGELSSDRGSQPTSVSFNHKLDESGTSHSAHVKIWAARNRSGISVSLDGGQAATPFKQRSELITAYIPGLAGLSERETILVQPLLRRQAACGDAGSVLRNILFNINSRQPGEVDYAPALKRVQKLNQLVQMVHPDFWIEVNFNEREDFNIQAVFNDSRLAGSKRPLETAATGVLQVIQIFAYLILFRPKLLLIDEPDAHLHPDKQERLIEALELAAEEFQVQSILTTHSPHIVRAASPSANLIWINNGKVIEQDDETIKTLLGWGGLDKKILFFIEDENDQAIRAILRQWPGLYRQISICRCFGVDNLPRNSMLKGLLGDNNFGVSVIIHRDRDFMTDEDCMLWSERYSAQGVHTWITDHVDAEAYFCQPDYLAALYNISNEEAERLIATAAKRCTGTRKTYFEKRKLIIRMLYEHGGGDRTENLWALNGEEGPRTTLGKTLHKSLKAIAKENSLNEKLLDKFTTPYGFEIAPSLKYAIEKALEKNKSTCNPEAKKSLNSQKA